MIHLLDENTIEKIAAGEVIERPVSVVKELIENSIDAGAENISLEIIDGGKQSIIVTDDGWGIEKEDLDLAFTRHATSKILDFSDLFKIKSMGFRGEALASIAACSRLTARSRTKNMGEGIELVFEGGRKVSQMPVVMSVGTQMKVEDLFVNLPVRRKFLSSGSAEGSRISKLMYNLAVGNPGISFRYTREGKRIFQTSGNADPKENLLLLFGSSYYDSILQIEGESNNYKIRGMVSNNTYYRGNRQMQHIFLNGRLVEDDQIRDRIEECYKSIIPNGRYPAFQIFIETDPANLDINIHPNKKKVSYFGAGELLDLISYEIDRKLYESSAIPGEKNMEKRPGLLMDLTSEDSYKEILDTYSKPVQVEDKKPQPFILNNLEPDSSSDRSNYEEYDDNGTFEYEDFGSRYLESIKEEDPLSINELGARGLLPDYESLNFIGIVFKTYIIFEDIKEDRLLIFDQHAAHERVNYERFLKKLKSSTSVSQKLLDKERILLDDMSLDKFESRESMLKKLGFTFLIENNEDVYITGVPAGFSSGEYMQILYDILDINMDNKDVFSLDRFMEACAMKACKASVKQGDKLNINEVRALYNSLKDCQYPLSCPHGRPTFIFTGKRDLENRFMRNK